MGREGPFGFSGLLDLSISWRKSLKGGDSAGHPALRQRQQLSISTSKKPDSSICALSLVLLAGMLSTFYKAHY